VILTQDLCHVCEVDAGQVTGVVAGMDVQPEIVVLQPKTIEGVLDSFLQIGLACGAETEANEVIAKIRQRVRSIQDKLPAAAHWPRVFSIEGINPLVLGGHWIPDLLELAGGNQDLLPSGSAAKRLEWSEVHDYNPDKLFVDLCSSDLARNLREVPWLESQEGWRDMTCVQNGEVYLIDHSYFSRPGPRTIEGLEILAQLTHPDIFNVIVSGINKVKKHQKPDNNQAGGIIEKEMPIHISNLAFHDTALKKGVRVGFKFDQKNKKIRINKNSGKII